MSPAEQEPVVALPTFDDVLAAAETLRGIAHRTPAATSRALDERVGARVFLKCENLQRVGAFKIRGAYNAISALSPEQRARGVVAFSSGNHAQGVALAARLLDTRATVVMPRDAPRPKRLATESYGATVIEYDPATASREALAAELLETTGGSLIPPFDHAGVIAGQGTAALELFEDVGELDVLLVPCGGGGLLSGSALSARALSPRCRVIGVEPELGDDATRSFRTRTLQTVRNPPTIADGTRTPSLGKLTFPMVLANVDDMVTVSEAAIGEAVRFLLERTKLVVEPSGALGVAALLSGAVPGLTRAAPPAPLAQMTPLTTVPRIGVILSGGNIDPVVLISILQEG